MNKIPNYDITIKAGSDYAVDFAYEQDDGTPVSLAGWTAEAQLRDFPQMYYAHDFTCSADQDGIHLTMPHEETAEIRFDKGSYDVFIIPPDGSTRTKLIEGMAEILPEVTR